MRRDDARDIEIAGDLASRITQKQKIPNLQHRILLGMGLEQLGQVPPRVDVIAQKTVHKDGKRPASAARRVAKKRPSVFLMIFQLQ